MLVSDLLSSLVLKQSIVLKILAEKMVVFLHIIR